jgi:aspartate aminotransferase
MSLSKIAESIGASATIKLNETANSLRAQGVPVIHLGGGEPKSKAPADAITAAASKLETGEIRYTATAGIMPLREAVVDYTEKYYQKTVAPGNILVSSGAKQAIMMALQAILNPGDELLYPIPYWVSYPEMVKLVGAKPVAVLPEEDPTQPTLDEIKAKVTASTKAIMLNSPSNPSGVIYTPEFISDIVNFCESENIYLIMDDIYHRLVFDGQTAANCYEYTSRETDDSKIILINGVSKSYAMTGFRIGWAVAAKEVVSAMSRIQSHFSSGSSELTQWAAIGALRGSQDGVTELRKTLESNRNLMVDLLSSIDGVKVAKPGGTFYCFPDFSGIEKDSAKLAAYLIKEAQVVTVPGIEFGSESHLRISFCGSVKDIKEGCERIKAALASY